MGGTDCRCPALDLYLAENNLQQLGLLADYFSMRPEFAVRGTFTEGSVLLRALRERPVDLVITSLELRGDMDARELLVAMGQAELLHPPRVIVVFDAELPALQARCLQAGADYYLVKPYTLQRLASRALDVCESFGADGQDPLDGWLIRLGLRPGDSFYSCFRCCLQAAMACVPATVFTAAFAAACRRPWPAARISRCSRRSTYPPPRPAVSAYPPWIPACGVR